MGLCCGELIRVVECVEGVCVRSAGSDSGEWREWGIDKGVSGKKNFIYSWLLLKSVDFR